MSNQVINNKEMIIILLNLRTDFESPINKKIFDEISELINRIYNHSNYSNSDQKIIEYIISNILNKPNINEYEKDLIKLIIKKIKNKGSNYSESNFSTLKKIINKILLLHNNYNNEVEIKEKIKNIMINMVNINIIKQNVSKYKNGIKSTVNSINYGNVPQNFANESKEDVTQNNSKNPSKNNQTGLLINSKVNVPVISSTVSLPNSQNIKVNSKNTKVNSKNNKVNLKNPSKNNQTGLLINSKVNVPVITSTVSLRNSKNTKVNSKINIFKGDKLGIWNIPEGWIMITVAGDGTCGYHAIMKYLELNDQSKYNEVLQNCEYNKIIKNSTIVNQNKPGFCLRNYLVIKLKSILDSLNNKTLNTQDAIGLYHLEYMNYKIVDGISTIINYVENGGWLDQKELVFLSIFLNKNIFVFNNSAGKWTKISNNELQNTNNNNSIFLINQNEYHYNTLIKKDDKIFKYNFSNIPNTVLFNYNFFI